MYAAHNNPLHPSVEANLMLGATTSCYYGMMPIATAAEKTIVCLYDVDVCACLPFYCTRTVVQESSLGAFRAQGSQERSI